MNYYTRDVSIVWATFTVFEILCLISCHEWLFHRLFSILGIFDILFWLGCAFYVMFTLDVYGDREKDSKNLVRGDEE